MTSMIAALVELLLASSGSHRTINCCGAQTCLFLSAAEPGAIAGVHMSGSRRGGTSGPQRPPTSGKPSHHSLCLLKPKA